MILHNCFPRRTASSFAALLAVSGLLTACSREGHEVAPHSPAPEQSTTIEAPSSTTEEASTTPSATYAEGVEYVAQTFHKLAPEEFFAQLDQCNPGSFSNSWECSGDEVGQFQFFDSDSRAASTSSQLTQLRNSKVVVDDGSRMVGWMTVASVAVITVVDTDEGLVMQQMLADGREEPQERIVSLGLANESDVENITSQTRQSQSPHKESETESASETTTSQPTDSEN